MKRFVAVILSVSILLFSFSVCSFAADKKSRIFSEAITASPGDDITVDVKIENNTGFMGFELFVSYDSEKLTPISVTRGELLSGILDDSIETSQQKGSYKIVYSGADEAEADGVIVTLTFKASNSSDTSTNIIFSAENDGFFDEQYNEVPVTFDPITVNFSQKDLPLSERIKSWAAGLSTPFNTIMGVLVAPLVLIISLFE